MSQLKINLTPDAACALMRKKQALGDDAYVAEPPSPESKGSVLLRSDLSEGETLMIVLRPDGQWASHMVEDLSRKK